MERKYFWGAVTLSAAVVAAALYLPGCAEGEHNASCVTPLELEQATMEAVEQLAAETAENADAPKVYFTKDISADGIFAAYEALGLKPNSGDKVAVKIHSGEPGGDRNFVNPAYLKKIVDETGGTFVETNAAYRSDNSNPLHRLTTAIHRQVVEQHGFTAVAAVEILDEDPQKDDSLVVTGVARLKGKNYVGQHFKKYDFHIVASHFKGHALGGFGGALKNISIGYASAAGKIWIHSAGAKKGGNLMDQGAMGNQNAFLESMAEAAQSVVAHANGKILFINVMNNMSIDCDCMHNKTAPKIKDIGVLASLDPVALDRACLDIIDSKNATIKPEARSGSGTGTSDLLNRIQQQNGRLTVNHAVKLGVGDTTYQFIDLDAASSILERPRELPKGLEQIDL